MWRHLLSELDSVMKTLCQQNDRLFQIVELVRGLGNEYF